MERFEVRLTRDEVKLILDALCIAARHCEESAEYCRPDSHLQKEFEHKANLMHALVAYIED